MEKLLSGLGDDSGSDGNDLSDPKSRQEQENEIILALQQMY
jgi:hypothetical protein